MLLIPFFHLRFTIQSWFTNPSEYTSLQPGPPGTEEPSYSARSVLCLFSWSLPLCTYLHTPHSTPNNSFASISSIHLISASAICQQSPGSFSSMFSRLEFSEEAEKERTKDWEGRCPLIGKQESTVWANNPPPLWARPSVLKTNSKLAVWSMAPQRTAKPISSHLFQCNFNSKP